MTDLSNGRTAGGMCTATRRSAARARAAMDARQLLHVLAPHLAGPPRPRPALRRLQSVTKTAAGLRLRRPRARRRDGQGLRYCNGSCVVSEAMHEAYDPDDIDENHILPALGNLKVPEIPSGVLHVAFLPITRRSRVWRHMARARPRTWSGCRAMAGGPGPGIGCGPHGVPFRMQIRTLPARQR